MNCISKKKQVFIHSTHGTLIQLFSTLHSQLASRGYRLTPENDKNTPKSFVRKRQKPTFREQDSIKSEEERRWRIINKDIFLLSGVYLFITPLSVLWRSLTELLVTLCYHLMEWTCLIILLRSEMIIPN